MGSAFKRKLALLAYASESFAIISLLKKMKVKFHLAVNIFYNSTFWSSISVLNYNSVKSFHKNLSKNWYRKGHEVSGLESINPNIPLLKYAMEDEE